MLEEEKEEDMVVVASEQDIHTMSNAFSLCCDDEDSIDRVDFLKRSLSGQRGVGLRFTNGGESSDPRSYPRNSPPKAIEPG